MTAFLETNGSFKEMVCRISSGRTISLVGELNTEAAVDLKTQFDTANEDGSGDILFIINSVGGHPDEARLIIDVFQGGLNRVIGLAKKKANSAAFLLLQGCHVRLAECNAKLLVHAPFWRDPKSKLKHDTTLEEYLAFHTVRYVDFHPIIQSERDIIIHQLLKRPSSFTNAESLGKFLDENHEMSAKEALALGFIDGIVDTAP